MADSDKTEAVKEHLARTGKGSTDYMTFADYAALERGDDAAIADHDAAAIASGERAPAVGATRQLTSGAAAPGTALVPTSTRKRGNARKSTAR